jgi:hypothetical protein
LVGMDGLRILSTWTALGTALGGDGPELDEEGVFTPIFLRKSPIKHIRLVQKVYYATGRALALPFWSGILSRCRPGDYKAPIRVRCFFLRNVLGADKNHTPIK